MEEVKERAEGRDEDAVKGIGYLSMLQERVGVACCAVLCCAAVE